MLGGCPTGEARITPGFNLHARWVIHTAGPIWRGGNQGESEFLASCYKNALTLAARPEHEIRRIAFPSISTGAYGFPVEQAAQVALHTIASHIRTHAMPELVSIVLFSRDTFQTYHRILQSIDQR